jgi:hypothetical protein
MTAHDHRKKFYCCECFANVEGECICDRIVGYDAETGIPKVDMTDEEWYYLYGSQVECND